jgi:hypothetical protein
MENAHNNELTLKLDATLKSKNKIAKSRLYIYMVVMVLCSSVNTAILKLLNYMKTDIDGVIYQWHHPAF